MSRCRICVCTGLVSASLTTFLTRAICAQAIIPVSYQLHVQAAASDSTGTVNDTPADITAGAVFDSFSHAADAALASGCRGTASIDVALADDNTIFGNIMTFRAGASATPSAFGSSAGGSGSGRIVVDVPEQITLSESARGFGNNFGNVTFKILRIDGSVFLSQSIDAMTNISGSLLTLPPDRYTFSIEVFRSLSGGGSAGASGLVDLKLVPEPSAVCLGGIAVSIVAQRRHRRPRVSVA
jgi:hypothetical protein